jgi:integral membrane sensor domain MASE1
VKAENINARKSERMNAVPAGSLKQAETSILLRVLAMALAYIATAQFAVSYAVMQSGIVVFWMPNAIVLVALLLNPKRNWWVFCLAAMVAELLVDGLGTEFRVSQALEFGLVNTLEALLAALLIKHFGVEKLTFSNLREVTVFAVIAMGIAPALAAIGGAWIYESSPGNEASYWMNWRIWWLGDGMGMIVIAPGSV